MDIRVSSRSTYQAVPSLVSNLTKGLSVYNRRGIYAPWIFYLSFSCQTCLRKNLSGAKLKQAASVESTAAKRAGAEYALLGGGRFSCSVGRTLRGEKQKKIREKAAQNNQISEKTSLFWKRYLCLLLL